MSGLEIFADTNILIHYLRGDTKYQDVILNNDVSISFVTELELYGKASLSTSEVAAIDSLIAGCNVLQYSNALKHEIIALRQKTKLKLPDAIIAATALHHQLPFLTVDSDFRKVDGLNVVVFL